MAIIRDIRQRVRYYLDRSKGFGDFVGDTDVLQAFLKAAGTMPAPRVLELGTKRLYSERTSMHKHFVPHASEFLGADILDGDDVDIVADVHSLSGTVGKESFDIIISCSSFEHFKYPRLAAHQIMATLKVGGCLFIQTHQSFPLHSAPFDYFRFSREALAGVFGTKMGFEALATDYEFPSRIFSKESAQTRFLPSFLNVRLVGRKTAATPVDFVYEFDG